MLLKYSIFQDCDDKFQLISHKIYSWIVKLKSQMTKFFDKVIATAKTVWISCCAFLAKITDCIRTLPKLVFTTFDKIWKSCCAFLAKIEEYIRTLVTLAFTTYDKICISCSRYLAKIEEYMHIRPLATKVLAFYDNILNSCSKGFAKIKEYLGPVVKEAFSKVNKMLGMGKATGSDFLPQSKVFSEI
jgi:hypothetical protein